MGCNGSKTNFSQQEFSKDVAKYDYNNTKTFSFEGQTLDCKVVKVYDGDTIWVVFRLYHDFYKMKIRLAGIDTPEIKSKNFKEKEKGKLARDYLSHLIYYKIVKIDFGKYDKYGRVLGTIFYNGKNINQVMIDKGFAYKYNGGTKLTV